MLVNQVIGQYILIISSTLCNVIYMQNNTVKGLVSRNNNITVMEVRLVQQMGFIKLDVVWVLIHSLRFLVLIKDLKTLTKE